MISSANCMEWYGEIIGEKIELKDNDFSLYELVYSDFKGGHSGGNIGDVKRGNPLKLGCEVLSENNELFIQNIIGGSRVNVIPRDLKIVFWTKENEFEKMKNKVAIDESQLDENTSQEIVDFTAPIYWGEDGCIILKECNSKEEKSLVYDGETSKKVINFINSFENGAREYDENNNVILSANMGKVSCDDNKIIFEYSLRANDLKLRNLYLENLKKIEKEYGIEIFWEQELKGVEPQRNSSLVKLCTDTYKKLFDENIELKISQGVVEGGFFKYKISDLEYVCIGPNTYDVHSPKEKVSIKSINKVWKYIKKIISDTNI